LDPEPRGVLEKLRSSHGPRPLLSSFSEEENSLCGRNARKPTTREIQHSERVKIRSQICNKFKIYYSYFIAVIELRGLPLYKRADKMARSEHQHASPYYIFREVEPSPII
jgi:hypothetical protein